MNPLTHILTDRFHLTIPCASSRCISALRIPQKYTPQPLELTLLRSMEAADWDNGYCPDCMVEIKHSIQLKKDRAN